MRRYMMMFLCFFLLCIPSCLNPYGAMDVTYYTQNLSVNFWSEDEQFIYSGYVNMKDDSGEYNYFILKVNVENGHFSFLKEDSGAIPTLLDIDRRDDTFLSLFPQKRGVYKISKNSVDKFLDFGEDIESGLFGQFIGNYGFLLTTQRVFSQKEIKYTEENLGVYEVSEDKWDILKIQYPDKINRVRYARVNSGLIYFSDYQRDGSLKDGQGYHALGELDLKERSISKTVMIPDYSAGELRFWTWLSNDEILFSLVNKDLEHLQTVSYRVSTKEYQIREDFQKRGLISPQHNWVAYVEGTKLMISKPDGTNSRLILDAERDLPKGAAQTL